MSNTGQIRQSSEPIEYRTLSDIALNLPAEQVWRLAGVRRGADEIGGSLQAAGQEAIARGRALVRPRAMWGTVAVAELESEGVRLEAGPRFSSRTVSRLLRGADSLAVALVTIGGELEAEARQRMETGDYLLGMLLDAVGSVAVFEVADHVRDRIAREAAELGLEIGPSLAPGARFWPLEDQQVIFDLLPAARIDVQLSRSFFITPEKAESFVIGRGQNLKVKDRPGAACRFCGRADCAQRAR